MPLPHAGRWQEIVNTDAETYGGSGKGNGGWVEAKNDGKRIYGTMLLPPLSTVMLEYVPD